MIRFEFIRDQGILTVTPECLLESADFQKL